MKNFTEEFYTEDYDQEMLDFIEENYSVDKINGCYKPLTKEQFKEKIGMTETLTEKSTPSDKNTFTKDMLKDGMFVRIKEDIYMVLGKVLSSYERYILAGDYDLGLNDHNEEMWNIQEVYVLEEEDNMAPLNYFLSGNGLKSIWKRPPEKTLVQKHLEEKIAVTRKHLIELEELLEANS